jgi:hypothetical protein
MGFKNYVVRKLYSNFSGFWGFVIKAHQGSQLPGVGLAFGRGGSACDIFSPIVNHIKLTNFGIMFSVGGIILNYERNLVYLAYTPRLLRSTWLSSF